MLVGEFLGRGLAGFVSSSVHCVLVPSPTLGLLLSLFVWVLFLFVALQLKSKHLLITGLRSQAPKQKARSLSARFLPNSGILCVSALSVPI